MAGRCSCSQTARQVQSLFYYTVYLLYQLSLLAVRCSSSQTARRVQSMLLSLLALPYKSANTDTPEALRVRESYRKRLAGHMLAAALLRRAACEDIARVRAASAALTARLRCALYTAAR